MTIRTIAAAAGVSPALVVRHYESKDGLREAADGYVSAVFEAMLTEFIGSTGTTAFDQDQSQWFRNLIANPQVRVSVAGCGPRAATARRLAGAEADAALADYVDRHPRAWAKFKNEPFSSCGDLVVL